GLEYAVDVGFRSELEPLFCRPCVLIGHGAKTSDELDPPIFGSDLGFGVKFEGKTYFFFGDTWVTAADGSPSAYLAHTPRNDPMAWTTDSPATSPGECPQLEIVRGPHGHTY